MSSNEKHNNYPSTLTLDSFSSTTKLANDSKGQSKESVNQKDELYNPFDHRNPSHPTSTMGSLAHLLKSSLGSGILAMPHAFHNAGLIFGFVGTIVVGFLCAYCVHILVKVSHDICRRAKIPSLGFAETCGAAFEYGPKAIRKFSTAAKISVDVALVVTYAMANCVYVVFISESLQQLFDYWFPAKKLSIYMYMLMVMAFLLLTAQVRELKHLVPFSVLANIFMIISFSITLYYMFDGVPDPAEREYFTSFGQLPMFFSTVIFAMEGIGVVMPVENNMQKPQHFLGCPGVLTSAMSIVIVLYAIIGFFGYLKYGDDTKASITHNLPVTEIPAQIVKLLIALSVFFTYNLQMYVPMDIIWNKLVGPVVNGNWKRQLTQVGIRCLFVFLTIGIAAAVPKLDAIIGLVGSICFATLGLLIPSVVETVHHWGGELGFLKWRLIKNTFLAAFALFALVSGTIESIKKLMEETPEDEQRIGLFTYL